MCNCSFPLKWHYCSALELVHLCLISFYLLWLKGHFRLWADVISHLCNQIHARLVLLIFKFSETFSEINQSKSGMKTQLRTWLIRSGRYTHWMLTLAIIIISTDSVRSSFMTFWRKRFKHTLIIELQDKCNHDLKHWWFLIVVCDLAQLKEDEMRQ